MVPSPKSSTLCSCKRRSRFSTATLGHPGCFVVFVCLFSACYYREFENSRGQDHWRSHPQIRGELDSLLFVPVLPETYGTVLADGVSTIESKLREWRVQDGPDSLFAQIMPEPVASLIARGHFATTLLLGRCKLTASLFPDHALLQECVASAKPLHVQADLFPKKTNIYIYIYIYI